MSATPQRCYDTGVWLVAPMLQASLSPATSPGAATPTTSSSSSWNSLGLWAATGVLLLLVVVLLVCPVAVALSGQ